MIYIFIVFKKCLAKIAFVFKLVFSLSVKFAFSIFMNLVNKQKA